MPESRRKYEIKNIILLGVILVVLVGLLFLVKSFEETANAPTLSETSEFQLLGTATGLELMVDGDHFEIDKVDSVWKLKGDDDFKVNDTMCDGIMYQMKNLPINRVIENGMEEASKYGLDDTNNWICIHSNSGDAKFLVGEYNSVTLEFYIAFEGGSNVYMADYNSIAYCLRPLSNFENTDEETSEE